MTVLVTGARGDVGGAVLAGLAAVGEPVRASSRAPRPGEFPGGVEVARADLADPASWPAALAGVRKVFLYAHPEGAAEFAAAARKAGVEHVVLLSSSTVLYPDAAASPIALRHLAAERALTRPGLTGPSCGRLLRHERAALVAVDPHRARPAHRVPRSGHLPGPRTRHRPGGGPGTAGRHAARYRLPRARGRPGDRARAGRRDRRGARRADAAGAGGRGHLPRPTAHPAARADRRGRPPGPRERAPAARRRGARGPGPPPTDIRRTGPRPRSRPPLTA